MSIFGVGATNRIRTAGRRLLPAAIGALLTLLLLILIGAGGSALAQDVPVEPAATDAAAKLTLHVKTSGSSSYVTTTEVINSEIITFEFRFQNTTGATVNNLGVLIDLRQPGLDTFECLLCIKNSHPESIINALGETEIVQVIDTLEWKFAGNVANGATVTDYFTARVVGQAGGTVLENTALASYNPAATVPSNPVRLSVVADVPGEPVSQANAVSATPNWFSNDKGGTLDLDWADVDQDGDLDLALASSLGTAVYLNDGGQLRALWRDPNRRVVYGVRWLDVNGDGVPELVAVGSPDEDEIGGINYVFQFNPGTFLSPTRFTLMANGEFKTANQLTRIETGHFNNDTLPDLLVSVNAISAECPVFILYNEGANLFNGEPACVSSAATAAIQAGDVNKDGLADLAIGVFPNQVRVIVNTVLSDTAVLSQTNPLNILVDASNRFLPYDFAWGDVDGDGDLDLAAAFPLQREVRLYRNNQTSPTNVSFSFWLSIPTSVFQTPYAVEFGDLDRDGAIDLVVGDAQPTIYWNTRDNAQPYSTNLRSVLTLSGERSETWAIRAVDQDGNGSLELSIANRNGPSMLLANYASALSGDFTPIGGSGTGGSIAWGDYDNNGYNDLLIGSPPNNFATLLYINQNGGFSSQDAEIFRSGSTGSHAVALGDLDPPAGPVDQRGWLEAIMLTPNNLTISSRQGQPRSVEVPGLAESAQRIVAAGDMDGDGDLDIALGLNPGKFYIVENRAGESPSSLILREIAGMPENVTAIAWGDYNNDHYLDLAVGSTSGLGVFVNNSDGTFTPIAANRIVPGAGNTCLQGTIHALAWGDVNGDGLPDLAVGNAAQPGCLLQNNAGTLTAVQQFSTDLRNVSSLDWGDWDNDGDLDLAVGHASGPVRVLSNTAGRLLLLWQSKDSIPAASVRWGDKDGDSDLDLAVARASGPGDSGYFENRLVEPAHLLGEAEASLLPNPSAYVYVKRPGDTNNGYELSTSELLAGPNVSVIPINFTLFKPDGAEGDAPQYYNLLFDYSLDSGGSWQKATGSLASGSGTGMSTTLTRAGNAFVFNWNARADRAISEKALFRVSVINPSSGATVQNAVGMGISPPFQARATTCVWPEDPRARINSIEAFDGMIFTQSGEDPFASLTFEARLKPLTGDGVLTYVWTLDDGTPVKRGPRVSYVLRDGDYTVTLTAQGQACPVARYASKSYKFSVNIPTVYLPLMMLNPLASASSAASVSATASASEQGATSFDANVESLGDSTLIALERPEVEMEALADPVVELAGVVDGDSVNLSWRLSTPWNVGQVRIYRQPQDGSAPPLVEAQLPAVQQSYATLEGCGYIYAVVAVDGGGEIAAQQEYRTPGCDVEVAE